MNKGSLKVQNCIPHPLSGKKSSVDSRISNDTCSYPSQWASGCCTCISGCFTCLGGLSPCRVCRLLGQGVEASTLPGLYRQIILLILCLQCTSNIPLLACKMNKMTDFPTQWYPDTTQSLRTNKCDVIYNLL